MRPLNFLTIGLSMFLLIWMVIPVSSVIREIPGLYIDNFQFGIFGTTAFSSGTNHTQIVTWRYPLPTIISAGMAFHGYEQGFPNQRLSFKCSLLNTTASQATALLEVDSGNCKMKHLVYSLIIVTSSLYEVELVSHLFTSADPTVKDQITTITCSKFNLTSDDPYIAVMPQWMTGTGTINKDIYRYQINNFTGYDNILQIWLNTDNAHYIQQTRIIALFVGRQVQGYNTAWFESSYIYGNEHPGNMISYNMGINDTIFGKPYAGHKCALYFQLLQPNLVGVRNNIHPVMSGDDITHTTAFQIHQVRYNSMCVGLCEMDQFYTTSGNCQLCSSYMKRCKKCQIYNVCEQCPSSSLLVTKNACPLCRELMEGCEFCNQTNVCTSCFTGQLVTGGCSDADGCLQVVQELQSLGKLKARCVLCDTSQFHQTPVDGVCQCNFGHLAGQYCTTIDGCITTTKISGQVYCSACNSSGKFELTPSGLACVCKVGYILESGVCSSICGDGILIDQQCDDGNLKDGDGCSKACAVEKYYRCFYNTTTQMSSCRYVGLELNITLVSISKNADSHQGIFVFKIRPVLLLLESYDYASYFNFQCNTSEYSVVGWQYKDGQITLKVDYFTDLEDQSVSLSFAFNQFYIRHTPVSITFTAISDNLPLIYQENTSNFRTASYLFLATAAISLLILLISSAFIKMAAIEIITTLQLLFYLQFTIGNYNYGFQIMQELSLVGLSGLFLSKDSINFKMCKQYQKVTYNSGEAEISSIIIGCSLALVGVVWIVLKVAWLYFENEAHRNKIEKAYGYCWRVIFSLSIFLFLPFFLLLGTDTFHVTMESVFMTITIRSFVMLVALLVISIAFFNEFIWSFCNKKDDINQLQPVECMYPVIYLLYVLCQSMSLIILLRSGSTVYLYTLILLSSSMLLWFLVVRPYYYSFSNVSTTLTFMLVIAFELYVLLKKLKIVAVSNQGDIFVILIMSGWTICCVILQLIRSIRVIINKIKGNSPSISLQEIEDNQTIQKKERLTGQKKIEERKYPHFGKVDRESSEKKKPLLADNKEVLKEEDEVLRRLKEELKLSFIKKKNINRQVVEELAYNE